MENNAGIVDLNQTIFRNIEGGNNYHHLLPGFL